MTEKFSKIGFVLAMAGSAVGLGNAWKFPTMVGNNGGSAFILLYVLLTLGIACVAFLAELAIGALGKKNVVGSIHDLAPSHKNAWEKSGFFMIGAVLIASFYMVVIGWIFYYTAISFGKLPATTQEAGATFGALVSNKPLVVTICFSVIFFIVFYTVSKGIKSGIEKLNKFMMPALIVLLVLLLAYAVLKSGHFAEALSFIFVPDFSKIANSQIILQALGLAFFSMSMGVTTVSTYAASLPEKTNLVKSTLSIVSINILIGIMMGLVVFSFIPLQEGVPAASGPGLIFVSLASLFAQMGVVGNFLAVAFFVSLLFAGITSAVSMIEPFVAYLIGQHGVSRKKALLYIGVFIYTLGVFCILSYYEQTAAVFNFFGKPFFDVLDFFTSNILMPLGAITFSIFVGWVIDQNKLWALFSEFMSRTAFNIWLFALRFVVPLAIIAIGAYQFYAL